MRLVINRISFTLVCNFPHPMRYLVTGGAGFIGSHLTALLLTLGHEVRVLDDLSAGKKSNIPDDAEFILGSILRPEEISRAAEGCDGIFHLAARPNVQESIEKPCFAHDVNGTGTLNLLLAARDGGVRRVVFSSSSAVYGDQLLPQAEEMSPNPISPYAIQKLTGEQYARVASSCWGVETVSLRYFNAYGPRLSFVGAYYTVIAVFLKQRASGHSLTVTGDGMQTRDFVYVDDIARANVLAMESARVGCGEVINIGSGTRMSVNDIAKRFSHPIVHIDARIEPRDTQADIRRAKELLYWSPTIGFDEGLLRTMEWYEREGMLSFTPSVVSTPSRVLR